VIALSDTHAGHKLGLLNPDTVLRVESNDDGGDTYHPALNAPQKYLWDTYIEAIEAIKDIAGDDPVVVIHLGDLTQGNNYPREQISTRISDQLIIARDNFAPLLALPNLAALRLTVGTGSHEFGEGSSTEIIAEMIRGAKPGLSVKVSYHAKEDVAGCVIDYAHHGSPPGRRLWLRGNEVRYYLRDVMLSEIELGGKPANIYLRGHYHTYVREVLSVMQYESMMINLPSLCWLGDYGVQATRSAFTLDVGLIAIEIMDGEAIKVHKYIKRLDTRMTGEVLND